MDDSGLIPGRGCLAVISRRTPLSSQLHVICSSPQQQSSRRVMLLSYAADVESLCTFTCIQMSCTFLQSVGSGLQSGVSGERCASVFRMKETHDYYKVHPYVNYVIVCG